MSVCEYPKETFANIAFRTLFLQVHGYKGGLANFHVLYKIRRYVDCDFVSFEGSCFQQIANDIMQVKQVEDPYATDIVYSWMSLWSAACSVDLITQRNQFFFVCRKYISVGEDLGVSSLLLTNAVIGPALMMRYCKKPNCKMIIDDTRIYFEAIVAIRPGEYITVAKNAIVTKEFVLSEMEKYATCKLCKDNKSQQISEYLPKFTPVERVKFMKSSSISDMEKKVYEEIFHAYQKMNFCYRCLVHRCTYFMNWPDRQRLTLSNEIPFQTWTFSRLLTIENPKFLRHCEKDDLAHGYISDDEYAEYTLKRGTENNENKYQIDGNLPQKRSGNANSKTKKPRKSKGKEKIAGNTQTVNKVIVLKDSGVENGEITSPTKELPIVNSFFSGQMDAETINKELFDSSEDEFNLEATIDIGNGDVENLEMLEDVNMKELKLEHGNEDVPMTEESTIDIITM